MSWRANLLVLLTLAAGLCYGGFFVPWVMEPDPRDAELQELREENELLRSRLDAVAEIEKENARLRIEREIASRPRQQPINLVVEYQELMSKFEKARPSGQKLMKNPPPEDIKGRIKAVEDGLVTINLGSDSGLARDHTLEVYRLKPSPQYVGMVRILDVRPAEAVGKLIVRRAAVQVGDDVSSELVSRR